MKQRKRECSVNCRSVKEVSDDDILDMRNGVKKLKAGKPKMLS